MNDPIHLFDTIPQDVQARQMSSYRELDEGREAAACH